jgi:hypothetical protein
MGTRGAHWYFTKEELNRPVRPGGLDPAIANKYRRATCIFIQKAGIALRLYCSFTLSHPLTHSLSLSLHSHTNISSLLRIRTLRSIILNDNCSLRVTTHSRLLYCFSFSTTDLSSQSPLPWSIFIGSLPEKILKIMIVMYVPLSLSLSLQYFHQFIITKYITGPTADYCNGGPLPCRQSGGNTQKTPRCHYRML